MDGAGNPFPTLYWLTCPETVKAVSRLESEGWIKRLARHAETDPAARTALRRAHESYARERGRLLPGAERWGGVGGSTAGIKCLHAHYAHHLAGGPDPVGQWVGRKLAALPEPIHYERAGVRVAAIDLGTNSVRLLVARWSRGRAGPLDGRLTDLSRDMVITRIGQGVDRTGRLDPKALTRTLAVIRRYCRRARALGAERVRVSATSAVRDATNRDELASAVQELSREPLEVLSGEEEARTSFLGATRDLDAPRPHLVLDIGGGSTEVILGGALPSDPPQEAVSTQMGCVRLTERFVRHDPPAPEELDSMEEAVEAELASAATVVPVGQARTLVAVAGTATTVQAIALSLPEYDPAALHRSVLELPDAERVLTLLADMTTDERRRIPVMAPGREDVIPAGATILATVMRRWGFRRAIVSETDILDGLAIRLGAEVAAAVGRSGPGQLP